MPLYDYKCDSCGAVFEVRQKFSDEPLTIHDGCGGRVERLISPSAFNFKGTGWYVTDYARKKGGNGSGGGSVEAAKSESKVETKTEPKPPAAASTKPEAKK